MIASCSCAQKAYALVSAALHNDRNSLSKMIISVHGAKIPAAGPVTRFDGSFMFLFLAASNSTPAVLAVALGAAPGAVLLWHRPALSSEMLSNIAYT